MDAYQIALLVIGVMSVITFVAYAVDKAKAKAKTWRTPEKTLLLLSFLGGAVGGYIAMNVCRHKTKHWYFQVVNVASIILHVAIVAVLFMNF